jgi:hypothetical protein
MEYSEDFTLKEIIIGARCNLLPVGFKEMLSSYGDKVKVIKSRLAFQSFKVVQNKSVETYHNA